MHALEMTFSTRAHFPAMRAAVKRLRRVKPNMFFHKRCCISSGKLTSSGIFPAAPPAKECDLDRTQPVKKIFAKVSRQHLARNPCSCAISRTSICCTQVSRRAESRGSGSPAEVCCIAAMFSHFIQNTVPPLHTRTARPRVRGSVNARACVQKAGSPAVNPPSRTVADCQLLLVTG